MWLYFQLLMVAGAVGAVCGLIRGFYVAYTADSDDCDEYDDD